MIGARVRTGSASALTGAGCMWKLRAARSSGNGSGGRAGAAAARDPVADATLMASVLCGHFVVNTARRGGVMCSCGRTCLNFVAKDSSVRFASSSLIVFVYCAQTRSDRPDYHSNTRTPSPSATASSRAAARRPAPRRQTCPSAPFWLRTASCHAASANAATGSSPLAAAPDLPLDARR